MRSSALDLVIVELNSSSRHRKAMVEIKGEEAAKLLYKVKLHRSSDLGCLQVYVSVCSSKIVKLRAQDKTAIIDWIAWNACATPCALSNKHVL
jgi:hypothetical protein